MTSIKKNEVEVITPAIHIRNEYYQKVDAMYNNKTILFESANNEPKIILEQTGNTLLSKLSKSTAPIKAKLSKNNLWINSSSTIRKPSTTNIYPALLSNISIAFKDSIVLTTKVKNHIEYHDVFDGRDAINKISTIIKTSDRNLAILVGRSLDYQKFFHDVNYENRLRDSSNELYQFSNSQKENLPNGIFTLLTTCYSPTCSSNNNCYSSLCPRRFNQKQNQKNSTFEENKDRLWIKTVSKSISNNLTSKERKRQENIFEFIYTEKDFINDLIYIEQSWIHPLLDNDCIPIERRNEFIKDLFWNIKEIRLNNSILLNNLLERQQVQKVVYKIGDILLNHIPNLFNHFIEYGSHQFISKYIFENEKLTNPNFLKFVEMMERAPESRKLELNGYLTKPTTRLGRYNLLLKEILKNTPENHPDQESIPQVINIINQFLQRVNEESGKTENKFTLGLLEKRLLSLHNKKSQQHQEILDLELSLPERKIIMKGSLKKKNNGNTIHESSEFQIYVLDHCLLIVKSKIFDNNAEVYKLHKKPIPLALLSINLPDQVTKRSSSILPYNRSSTGSFYSTSSNSDFLPSPLSTSSSTIMSSPTMSAAKSGYPISFIHLGRQGSMTTLYAPNLTSRKKWADTIEQYRQSIMEKSKIFQLVSITNSFNKVNCAATFNDFIILGCDHGIYMKKDMDMFKIMSIEKVSQIDILENLKLMFILADKILYSFSLDNLQFDQEQNLILTPSPVLSNSSPSSSTSIEETIQYKNTKKISSNVSFFKIGKIMDKSIERTLVCYVKHNTTSSSIRALEPCEEKLLLDKKKKPKTSLNIFIRNTTETLKLYKDLYIPGEATSIQYFKNIICVGSIKGFQMVHVASTEVQSVLDPNDVNHEWIAQREHLKPISMFKHPDGCILLCYNEVAFYIDKKGRRIRSDWTIHWEGFPNAFAFYYPYILAFDPSFIEIRHVNTGDLTQIITGHNIRCLRWDPPESIYFVMDDRKTGTELVYQLKYTIE